MKIVFIINSISAQRCIKRVEEFIAHGYEVEAYGFSRKKELYSLPKHFSLKVVGEFDDSLPYLRRMSILKKGVKDVLQNYEHDEDIVYYLFQLDIALVFRLLTRNSNKYIFEESDIMHTYIKNVIVRRTLEAIDKSIIKHSLLSVFTSEGFLIYHYGTKKPDNAFVISNRLNTSVERLEKIEKRFEKEKLRIGFVGCPRYESIINFINVFCSHFPKYEFHIYGEIKGRFKERFEELRKFPNCFIHGAFLNPDDLPSIYSNIDLVLSTYDVKYENVRYAEPNKLYEAIYFETPIIVSAGTYLEMRVKRMGIGYSVDPMNEQSIVDLLKGMTEQSLTEKVLSCKNIDKKDCLNINEDFFSRLKRIFVQ